MKIRNKSLQMKVMRLTNAVVDLLNRLVKNRGYPTREHPKFLFKENGFETQSEAKIDFGLMLADSWDEILQLSEFVECAQYMVKNPTIKRGFKVTDKDGKPVEKVPLKMVLRSSLHPFLVTYFNKVGSLTFDEETFNDSYSEFEGYFYKKVEEYNLTSPLENFSCETDDIELGKGLKIRRISDMEKSGYLSLASYGIGFPTSFGSLNIVSVKYVLETTYLHRKETSIDTLACRRNFEDVVTALRLFKSGSVDFNVLRTASISWVPYFGTSYGSQGRYTSPLGPKYTLVESEVKPFKRVWKRYKKFRTERAKLKSNKYLDIALRRFNLGIEEVDIQDKMIDYLISFEALYLPERGELTYRLCNRVATLLGKEEKEAQEIRKIMTKAYDLRSDIVHGKDIRPIKIEGKTIELQYFASKVEEYLRRSIRFFIVLTKTHKKQQSIINLLDKALFDAKLKKKLDTLRKLAETSKKEMWKS